MKDRIKRIGILALMVGMFGLGIAPQRCEAGCCHLIAKCLNKLHECKSPEARQREACRRAKKTEEKMKEKKHFISKLLCPS